MNALPPADRQAPVASLAFGPIGAAERDRCERQVERQVPSTCRPLAPVAAPVDSGLGLSHFSDLAAPLIARSKVSLSNSIPNTRHLQAMIYGFQKRESIGIALPKLADQPRR